MSRARPGPVSSQGGEDALLNAYLARRGSLVRFFAARTQTPAAAEDLAQELYLKIVGRAEAAEVENPTALLYRMALNLMLDKARGDARAGARDADWRLAHRTFVGGAEIAEEPAADEATASRQRLRQLIDAVQGLPPQMRRAFVLHKLEGLSQAEAARAMGLSVKSVEKHVAAALKALTARLAP